MRRLNFIWVALCFWGLFSTISRGETFQLNDGHSITGEVIAGSADDNGVQLKVEDNRYERVPWSSFSQENLKQFAQDVRNQKMARFAAAFVEVAPADRVKKEVEIKPVPRLQRPPGHSVFGALFSSGIGIFLLLLLYAANIYAAYEISIFRMRPAAVVCGVSAVAPLLGPILFLALPAPVNQMDEDPLQPQGPAVIQPFAVPNPNHPGGASASEPAGAGGMRLATEGHAATTAIPQTQVFPRGAFTFNRRFFETKFSGFFGIIRHEAEKDLVLEIKAARGQYIVQRISRIASNELHAHIQKGPASEEVMIPFSEIQEVRLKHVNA